MLRSLGPMHHCLPVPQTCWVQSQTANLHYAQLTHFMGDNNTYLPTYQHGEVLSEALEQQF